MVETRIACVLGCTKEVEMTTALAAHVTLVDGLHFQGSVASGQTVELDTPTIDGGDGMTPMELVLISLAGCSAMDVLTILRKKRQLIEGLEVRAHGLRQAEHPTVFTTIELEYIVHGGMVEPQCVTRAIELSHERYCPVWAMLEPSVRITSCFRIVSDEPVLVPAD
jgi:putative redox protein